MYAPGCPPLPRACVICARATGHPNENLVPGSGFSPLLILLSQAAVGLLAVAEAFQALAGGGMTRLSTNQAMPFRRTALPRCRTATSVRMAGEGLEGLRDKVQAIKIEGLRADLLIACDKAQRGVMSPEGSEERARILALCEELEQLNPEPNPLASDGIMIVYPPVSG